MNTILRESITNYVDLPILIAYLKSGYCHEHRQSPIVEVLESSWGRHVLFDQKVISAIHVLFDQKVFKTNCSILGKSMSPARKSTQNHHERAYNSWNHRRRRHRVKKLNFNWTRDSHVARKKICSKEREVFHRRSYKEVELRSIQHLYPLETLTIFIFTKFLEKVWENLTLKLFGSSTQQ